MFLNIFTIEENIAFGIEREQIDHSKIIKAAEWAQISTLIDDLKYGYQTLVGERGMRLSGGQRQRIGLARAFYKQSDVLVLDEATSALDDQTESAVMKSIENMDDDITVLIIAHRLTTLKNCDKIIKFEKDFSYKTLTYDELMTQNSNTEEIYAS
ncbi:ATP-binding cassette domain-containing protein [Gammaproteobacteria bacterium]|nr:ATP-binding cassette domain-containing protein [Gammaproteobacteria bacterium]